MKNFIVGKKYPMRNGEAAEYLHSHKFESFSIHKFKRTTEDFVFRYFWVEDSGKLLGLPMDCDLDIVSDTPIEEESLEETRRYYAPIGEVHSLSLNTLPVEIHVNIEDYAESPVFLNGVRLLENENLGIIPKTRRQFDVSKLKDKPRKGSAFYPQDVGIYDTRLEVLEAWNAGTIEELLKGWVGE